MTFKFPFSHFIVSGNSMEPTLKEGQHVFSFNWFLKPKLKDIVVALVDSRFIIKRVVKIKNEELFLEGDNKLMSTDSRNFGWVNKSQVIGIINLWLTPKE
jgi:signal peptidase I